MRFPGSRVGLALTAVLLLEGGLFYATATRSEKTPSTEPLALFPSSLGGWVQTGPDAELDQATLDILKPSDTLQRSYVSPSSRVGVNLFIAYFQTQRTGSTPHSPKNCLPGSGWEPVRTPAMVKVEVPGRADPITVNQYLVAKGDQKDVVLYWYQSHGRVIASEFKAKFWLIADSIRYRRSDTSLIKVVVPAPDGDLGKAASTAAQFVQAVFPALTRQLPS